jgi:hypothetical protein
MKIHTPTHKERSWMYSATCREIRSCLDVQVSVNSLCVEEVEDECETEVVAGAGLICQVYLGLASTVR